MGTGSFRVDLGRQSSHSKCILRATGAASRASIEAIVLLLFLFRANILAQYVFPKNGTNILSLLPSEPTNPDLAIGVSSKLPPTPDSFKENPKFLETLQDVMTEHGHKDPDAISQAQVMVSTSGANLSTGGVLLTGGRTRKRRSEGDSSGGASGQGGAGSAGRGGWIHLSDNRRPPEYGRIAWYGWCPACGVNQRLIE